LSTSQSRWSVDKQTLRTPPIRSDWSASGERRATTSARKLTDPLLPCSGRQSDAHPSPKGEETATPVRCYSLLLHYFKSTPFTCTVTDMMIFRFTLLLAVLVARNSQGFTPKLPSIQWTRQHTQLFDSEPTAVWNAAPRGLRSPARIKESAEEAYGSGRSLAKLDSFAAIEKEYPGKRKLTARVRDTGQDSLKNYIKTMCDHDLLNKNEEIILGREIQILVKWEGVREELEQQLLR